MAHAQVYEVTIAENGDVTWNGSAFVRSTGVSHSRIDSQVARSLIQQFQQAKFWTLCAGYDASITDSASAQICVQIGGRSKAVWNYANSAPPFLETFEKAIDATANTHEWRHGNPRTEPLSNIFDDTFMPKPGVTPLMKAAGKADVDAIKEAISRGDPIDEVDSSGWTALMYAAASSHSEPVQILLKAGANPNHRSFIGDTPLMTSAIARQFDEDLWRGGAEINAKNSDGVSALMILAASGDADEVKAALVAGADAGAKDARGRSSLDYLRLTNCVESPIVAWHTFETGGRCDHLDEDDVKQVASLLKNAKQKPRN